MQLHKMPAKTILSQAGGARVNFIIVAAIIALCAYSGYQYIPAAYQSYQYSDVMQQDVDRGAALGQSIEDIRKQLVAHGADYGVPPDAVTKVEPRDGRLEATVRFTRPVALPGYTYQYNFDRTVKSSSLFTSK